MPRLAPEGRRDQSQRQTSFPTWPVSTLTPDGLQSARMADIAAATGVAVGSNKTWPGQANDCGLTRGPDNNTTTCQDQRQPRAVKLARVRRATARGSHDISARKAAGFSPELDRAYTTHLLWGEHFTNNCQDRMKRWV